MAKVVTNAARRLEPITSPTLVDTVVDRLRDSILSGRFAPGERLVEAELAREMGISRGPIREALALLEKDGIVMNVPRRGKFVPALDARVVEELYSLRAVLEPYAAQLIIDSLTDDKVRALKKSVALIKEAADTGDVLVLAERDIAFHNMLYNLSGHELLMQTWRDNIAGKLRLFLNITTRTHVPLIDTAANHRVLVEAIVAKDRRRARRLVTEHIDDARRRARLALEDMEAGQLVEPATEATVSS
jgi:DNA-binding GntR family transcriptional regulator